MTNHYSVDGLFAKTAGRFLLVVILILLLSPPTSAEWDWSSRFGLNYDFISHDYYLRTTDTLGLVPDSLAALKSYSDRIDEKGAFLRFDVKKNGALKLAISNKTYFTDEKLRDLITLSLEWGRLKLTSNAEFRSYGDTTDFTLYKSQLINSSRLAVKLISNDKYKFEVSQELEYSGYQDRDPVISGYYQSESRLKFLRRLTGFSDLELNFRFDRRESYDSSQLDFSRFISDVGYNKITAGSYLSANLYLERRDYALPDGEDDYFYLAPTFRFDKRLSDKLYLEPEIELQYYSYDRQQFVTFSNWRLQSELKLKYHYQLLSTVSFGFGTERFAATATEFAGQDYRSRRILAGFETFSSSWFSLMLDSQYGWRDYSSTTDEFYTDYNFLRFDLLADLQLSERIRFSCIGGLDFEYHDDKENDISVHLLSASIYYQIR